MTVKIRIKSTEKNTSVFLLTSMLEIRLLCVVFTIFLDKTSNKSGAGRFCPSSSYQFLFFLIRIYEIGQYKLLSNHNLCFHEYLIHHETCM